MKRQLLLIIFLSIIFFIPEGVEAETTVTMCKSGCDYTNFDEIVNAYTSQTLTDKELIIEVGEGEYDANNKDFISNLYKRRVSSIKIKGVSKEKTIIKNHCSEYTTYDGYSLSFENVSIESLFFDTRSINSINLENVNITFSLDNSYSIPDESYLIRIYNLKYVLINNVNVDISNYNETLKLNCLYIYSENNYINNLTINSNYHLNKGLFIDNTKKTVINGLTVNNSEIGLYVHREKEVYNDIDSSVKIDNSDLSNNTCSSFNVFDNNKEVNLLPIANRTNKYYQVVFNSGNKLNCAVASGTDTNTFVSGDNTWSKTPNSYTYDEINYDNLTDTTQNVNKGTVDVGKKYKGTVTIEVGSSVDGVTAFLEELDLNGVTWTVKDESISKIENGKILGIKEGITTITGVSSDGLTTYEIEVNVIKNPVTNSSIYVIIGLIIIVMLGTIVSIYYKKKFKSL